MLHFEQRYFLQDFPIAYLTNSVSMLSCSHYHLHLEHIPFRYAHLHKVLQDLLAIQPRRPCPSNHAHKKIGGANLKLPVRSDAPGLSVNCAKKFAPRLDRENSSHLARPLLYSTSLISCTSPTHRLRLPTSTVCPSPRHSFPLFASQ